MELIGRLPGDRQVGAERVRPIVSSAQGLAGEETHRVRFEQFLDVELDGLTRYARAMSRNRDDAHDLLAESLIKAQKAWPRISGGENPAAYVRLIITNTLISERRSWFSRHIRPSWSGELPDREVAASTNWIDTRDQLAVLLITLPPQQRAAVVLRYYLDLDYPEIAAELNCSLSAARSYLSRGLAALRINHHESSRTEEQHG